MNINHGETSLLITLQQIFELLFQKAKDILFVIWSIWQNSLRFIQTENLCNRPHRKMSFRVFVDSPTSGAQRGLSLNECINKDTACQFANLYFTPRQKILSCRNRISMSRNTKRTPTKGSSWGFFVYRRAFPADVSSESARIVLWENGG